MIKEEGWCPEQQVDGKARRGRAKGKEAEAVVGLHEGYRSPALTQWLITWLLFSIIYGGLKNKNKVSWF